MTENEFRSLALSLPEAEECEHMRHPDFRVGGRIFATLGRARGQAVVMLTPDLQEAFVKLCPDGFEPVAGGWGRNGATIVTLARCPKRIASEAVAAAWRAKAPRKLLARLAE